MLAFKKSSGRLKTLGRVGARAGQIELTFIIP